jgi:hypothetical protein
MYRKAERHVAAVMAAAAITVKPVGRRITKPRFVNSMVRDVLKLCLGYRLQNGLPSIRRSAAVRTFSH